MFFFDLRRAFSSGNRERLFFDLIAKFPGEKFIHKLRNCYNNLMMHINLGFTDVKDIEYLRGVPEGSVSGAILFVIYLNSVVE